MGASAAARRGGGRHGHIRLACLKMHLFVLMAVEPGSGVDEDGCGRLLFRALRLGLRRYAWSWTRGASVRRGLGFGRQAIVSRRVRFLAEFFHHAWQKSRVAGRGYDLRGLAWVSRGKPGSVARAQETDSCCLVVEGNLRKHGAWSFSNQVCSTDRCKAACLENRASRRRGSGRNREEIGRELYFWPGRNSSIKLGGINGHEGPACPGRRSRRCRMDNRLKGGLKRCKIMIVLCPTRGK